MKLRLARCLAGLLAAVAVFCAPAGAALLPEPVAAIPEAVEAAIGSGETPGAVVLLVQDGEIVLRRAFGHRRLGAHPAPMTVDTVFDLASLTKVVATAEGADLHAAVADEARREAGAVREVEEERPAIRHGLGRGEELVSRRQLLQQYSD